MPSEWSSENTDSLTGFYVRDLFTRKLTELAGSGETFCLAVVDIDHFKSVNDGFGHRRGDEILSEFGRRARQISREGDLLFRYGGDEFTVLIRGSDLSRGKAFAKRLLRKCSESEFSGEPPLSVTLSIGIAVCPRDGVSARDLFDAADRRLYSAKRKGRNRVVWTDDLHEAEENVVQEGRLLGRDRELAAFMDFTQEAAEKGRGFFLVLGPDGAGKGSFLNAAGSCLSLGDYRIISFPGTDSGAPFSALSGVLGCRSDRESVVEALYRQAGSAMSLGIFLHDLHTMDQGSMEALTEFYSIYPGWIIIAASTERKAPLEGSGFEGVSASVRLGPVSLEDCRAWFRSRLMWDPPGDFLEWFHGETGGLPGLFIQGLHHLERRGYLLRKRSSCVLEEDYREFPLGARITFGTSAGMNNLPVDLTPFVGREDELERIRDLIDRGRRLITLRGMGGMGCRRLAIRSAGQNEFMFPAGVCMVDCAGEGTSVAVRLASELSLPSDRTASRTIAGFLEDSRMLLIFVNVKPGDEAVTFIGELLTSCSGITVIATSRAALDLPGEEVVPVEGISLERIDGEPSPAAGIFIQTAERLAGIRFQGEMDIGMVEEICAMLGGAPLAIELAASWTRVMSVAAICRRIRANPSFLSGSDRSRTTEGLSDLFRQSWEQLSDVEKNALARLTVFAAHFTVQEAEEISDVSPEMLLSLVDRSFLLRDDMGINIPPMTRDFILKEKNPFSRGFEVAREMHCRYFAARTAAYGEMAWMGLEAGRGLDGIRVAFEDITLAWKLAVEKSRFRFLRQMLKPVYTYCMDRGRFRIGYNMMEEALSGSHVPVPEGLASVITAYQARLAARSGKTRLAGRLMAGAMENSQGLDDTDRAVVLHCRASLMMERGQLAHAESFLEEALDMFSRNGDYLQALETKLKIVNLHLRTGNYSAVRGMIPELARECRQRSFRSGEWKARLYLGRLAAAEGDCPRAREAFLSYLSSVKNAGYTGRYASGLEQLADIEASQGNLGEAEQHYRTAADYFRRIGSTGGQGSIRLRLAELSNLRGDSEVARQHYQEALRMGEKARDEDIIAGALSGIAFDHLEHGETEKAGDFLCRAAGTSAKLGNRPLLLRNLCGFARLDFMEGLFPRAAASAITILHDPASNARSEGQCLDLLRAIRETAGSEVIDMARRSASGRDIRDLLEEYSVEGGSAAAGIYRTGHE